MKASPLKELDYLVAWVIFFVLALLGGAVAGFIGGGVIGIVMASMGMSGEVIRAAGGILGFLLGIPVSFVSFRLIVEKFIVQKVQEAAAAAGAPTEPPPPNSL